MSRMVDLARSVAASAALLGFLLVSNVSGQDYSVEKIDSAPEVEDIPQDLLKQFASEGYRIKRGGSRTECELWFCKDVRIEVEFKPTPNRLYPFSPGQLIGLLHFGRRGSDFRDQPINRGWYTLRFGLQPVDGNHIGTSPTRDFLVMVTAADDEVDKEWDADELNEAGAEVAGSTHPAMICLQAPQEGEIGVRHDEANDWWILHAVAKGSVAGKSQDLAIDMVVIGHAAE